MIEAEGSALGVTAANWLDAPYNRWGFRHVPAAVPDRSDRARRRAGARRSRAPSAISADFAFDHRGRRFTLAEMLAETSTDGFLVIQDGAVVTERYFDGMRETDTHLLMSCSKSLTSILFGVLAGRGLLAPEDLVTQHLPELAGTAWEGCRLQHILDMRAGQRLGLRRGRVHDPRRLRLPHARAARHDPARHRDLDPHDRPRAARSREGPFRYCSLATDVLGWVLERVGGAPFPELFSREVWSRIGAEQDAQIMLDDSGFPVVEGGICTTLRDLARFGLMCLEDGARRRRADRAGRLDRPRPGARRRADRGVPRLDATPIPDRPTPSTTTSGGSTTARAASTRRSG